MLSRHAISVRSAHKAATSAISQPIESVAKTQSGLTVATIDNHGPLSQLILAFKAGSRYEPAGQAGLVHHLRNFVGRDTVNYPGISVVWSSTVAGANLKAFSTRDVIGVSLTVPRDETAQALSILGHAAAQPAFNPWEMEDVIPTIRADNGYRTPYNFVFEGIHQAAYRNGSLANSTSSPCAKIGSISVQNLSSFVKKHFVTGNGIVFAINLEQDELYRYAENYSPINEGSGVATPSSPYKGGEYRQDGNTRDAHVLIGGEGAPGSNAKAVAVQSVLLTALGNSSPVKFATSPSGVLSKIVGNGVSANGFQVVHSDSGLAGVYLSGETSKVAAALTSVAAELKSFKISDIEAVKKQALNNALRANAHSDNYSIERATQILIGADNYVNEISNVSASDVESAAKKISQKFSLASYGNVHEIPYVETL